MLKVRIVGVERVPEEKEMDPETKQRFDDIRREMKIGFLEYAVSLDRLNNRLADEGDMERVKADLGALSRRLDLLKLKMEAANAGGEPEEKSEDKGDKKHEKLRCL